MGLLLNLIMLALALCALAGWFLMWYFCVTKAEKIMRPIFGEAALGVALLGFPFVFFGGLLLILKTWHVEGLKWVLLTIFAAAPVVGFVYLKKEGLFDDWF